MGHQVFSIAYKKKEVYDQPKELIPHLFVERILMGFMNIPITYLYGT